MFQSYTYYLYHIPTGMKYYGVRLRPKSLPEQDLWIQYFSSSKKVSLLRKQYGNNSFHFEVRKQFENPEDALLWEQKVIDRMQIVGKNDWLNQSNSSGPFWNKGACSEETRRKISNTSKRRRPSEETREKIRKTLQGRTLSEETKKRMSLGKLGNKNGTGNRGVPRPRWVVEKLIQANKGKKHSPERIAKNRESHLGLKYTPRTEAQRKNYSNARKEWWRKRKEAKLLADQLA